MSPFRDCSRSDECLNFKRKGDTWCSQCGKNIEGHHFHDTRDEIRLCEECFVAHYDDIIARIFKRRLPETQELVSCSNYDRCGPANAHRMFRRKACGVCGGFPVDQHYHDVMKNVRYCLSCYQKLRTTD